METPNTWRPNQSGTFSNRVNIHDAEGDKLFIIEFHDKVTEPIDRIDIVRKICAAPDLYEALKKLVEAAKPHCVPTSQLNMRVQEAAKALQKATE